MSPPLDMTPDKLSRILPVAREYLNMKIKDIFLNSQVQKNSFVHIFICVQLVASAVFLYIGQYMHVPKMCSPKITQCFR
jgi:hypothetical protein